MNNIIENEHNDNDGLNDIQYEINKQLKQARFKQFCERNPDYFKKYYENNLKDSYFYCYCCKKEYLTTHKSRHTKTKKHMKNEITYIN